MNLIIKRLKMAEINDKITDFIKDKISNMSESEAITLLEKYTDRKIYDSADDYIDAFNEVIEEEFENLDDNEKKDYDYDIDAFKDDIKFSIERPGDKFIVYQDDAAGEPYVFSSVDDIVDFYLADPRAVKFEYKMLYDELKGKEI